MNLRFKFQIIIALHALSFIFYSCKEDETCPNCFKDFVRCKVNGKEWESNCVSNDPLFGCDPITCYYYIKDDYGFSLHAGSSNDNNGISLIQASGWGGARLGMNIINYREFGLRNLNNINNCIYLDSIDFNFNNFFQLLKIDTVNFVVEGKFGFKVFNLCGDTATVTDGYFKSKFIF